MATIVPFPALRPAPGLEARMAALPYDVFNREEARAEAKKDSLSFLNIDRPETQFPEDADMYASEVYEKAHALLQERIAAGDYIQDDSPCYYIYELTMNGRTQTGLCACASVDDYLSGVIARHENTRADKEADRIRHVDVCNAQTGPIFLAYRKDAQISQVVDSVKQEECAYAFTSSDGITHRGWIIRDPAQIAAIQSAFAAIPRIYIADGHHRAASAIKVAQMRREQHPDYTGEEPFNYFLCVLFPDEELMIMDYNRVVHDLNGLSKDVFLEALGKVALVQHSDKAPENLEKGHCGMYLDGQWYLLTFRPEVCSSDPVEGLDVSVLQNALLTPILGIGDPRTDSRISFVGGIRGTKELERLVDQGAAVAFAMSPTSIGELFAVADEGRLMPPKSTWFEPKLRSGLYIHLL